MNVRKDREFISGMFDEISRSYDTLNRLLSGFQDKKWRRNAVDLIKPYYTYEPVVMDLAAGTGDLGFELTRLKPAELYSIDISHEMLEICRKKISYPFHKLIKAEASKLPFANDYFDLCAVSFGIRNFEDLEKSLYEIKRVLRMGGGFLVIEFFKPKNNNFLNRLFMLYFKKILPHIGNKLSGSKYAYNYLFDSVYSFLTIDDYLKLTENSGFKVIDVKNIFFNFVFTIYSVKN